MGYGDSSSPPGRHPLSAKNPHSSALPPGQSCPLLVWHALPRRPDPLGIGAQRTDSAADRSTKCRPSNRRASRRRTPPPLQPRRVARSFLACSVGVHGDGLERPCVNGRTGSPERARLQPPEAAAKAFPRPRTGSGIFRVELRQPKHLPRQRMEFSGGTGLSAQVSGAQLVGRVARQAGRH